MQEVSLDDLLEQIIRVKPFKSYIIFVLDTV